MDKDLHSMVLKNSIYTPKKATWFKRILAFGLDIILFAVLLSGAMLLVSYISGYQSDLKMLDTKYIEYGIKVKNDVGAYEFCADVNGSTACKEAWEAFNKDTLACQYYDNVALKTLAILFGGIFITELILDYIIPMCLKNGRTIGMFCLGLAYIDVKDIKITHLQVFVHFLFGKYILVSVIPIFFFFLHFYNILPTYGLLICVIIVLANLIMKFATPRRVGFADSIARMYMIDNEAQVYCNTIEELSALKAKEAEEKAKQKKVY